MKLGICTNLPNDCAMAASKKPIEMTAPDIRCPECGKPLLPLPGAGKSPGSRRNLFIFGGIVALVVLASSVVALTFWESGGKSKDSLVPRVDPASPVAVADSRPANLGTAAYVLRLQGSNTIGSALGPSLAEAFLRREGFRNIERRKGTNPEELSLIAHSEGKLKDATIEIEAHGTGTAFEGLRKGLADVGMASRAIKKDEAESLRSLGDFTSSASEYVIALDGLAIIVNAGNPLSQLSIAQLRDLFTGRITSWDVLGYRGGGGITLYARDDKSGTFDTFKALVLGGENLAVRAKRIEDSAELSDAVASDSGGIGFIGLPYVRSSKAVSISDGTGQALRPTRFTVATEDYPLSRRLYLYVPENATPMARRFAEFATSDEGQQIAEQNGFVGQKPSVDRAAITSGEVSDEYKRLTSTAERLSVNLRFRSGSPALDNKAMRDLERISRELESRARNGGGLMLLGFADSVGTKSANLRLSQNRARSVAMEFGSFGVKPHVVQGFGSAVPIADNATDSGRERNRRVEVWLTNSSGPSR